MKTKSGKKTDKRPARARYKISGRLAARKVRQLVRHGRTLAQALAILEARRRPLGALPGRKELERIAEQETRRRALRQKRNA